jgi:hypothetical protein
MQEQWSMLILDERITFEDDDLYRLEFLPELDALHSFAPHLTDRGVLHFRCLLNLSRLVLNSPLVTESCLNDIASLERLRYIDLQGSPQITRKAFDRLVKRLPRPTEVFPP